MQQAAFSSIPLSFNLCSEMKNILFSLLKQVPFLLSIARVFLKLTSFRECSAAKKPLCSWPLRAAEHFRASSKVRFQFGVGGTDQAPFQLARTCWKTFNIRLWWAWLEKLLVMVDNLPHLEKLPLWADITDSLQIRVQRTLALPESTLETSELARVTVTIFKTHPFKIQSIVLNPDKKCIFALTNIVINI